MRAAFALYQFVGWLGLALGWPVLLLKAVRDPRYRVGWGERFGRWAPPAEPHPVWVHGASVGEIRAAAPLIAALREHRVPLVLSSTSPSGRAAAAALLGEAGRAYLLPLDLTPLVRRVFRDVRPRALVLVETEIWPSLLVEAQREGVPAVLVNARLSDRSFPRYRKLRKLLGPLLRTFRQIQAQSALDASRFVEIGGRPDRVVRGGNLKFDLPAPNPADHDVVALRRARAGGWRVVVGGSTHPGEEEALLAAQKELAARGVPVGLVLAPRHLERLGEAEAAVRSAGRTPRRWSDLELPLEAGILSALQAGEVILVDRYGLLGRLYGAAEVGFVGGTLVPVGGHNLLEPLLWEVPVVFGPYTANAREIRADIVNRSLGVEVRSAAGLADAIGRYLTDPEAEAEVRAGAHRLFEENRGAAGRAVAALEALGALDRNA